AAAGVARERAFARLATAVGKFFVCKRAPGHAYEALECLGGNGYVETWPLARVYREAPVNAIWEGSGNVVALDALRALAREPESLDAFFTEIALARGADRRLDAAAERLRAALATATRDPSVQADARRLVATMGVLLEASLLVRFAPPAVADAFSAARLGEDRAFVYGELSAGLALAPILARWNA
ncbi:MAG: acyl-CoA dehydrogenase family protein, partial [Vulcanimicrobiaceae bacterium]